MPEQLQTVVESTLAAFGLTLDPSRRLFWLFLLSSLVLALAVLVVRDRGWRWRTVRRYFFSRRYWFNRSTAQDVGLMTLNGVLRAAVVVPLVGGQLTVTLAVARGLQHSLGDAPALALPAAAVIALYSLSFFVLEDVSRYGLHRLMHRVPLLWRFHRVHHSARILTPLTLYRLHPVEMLLYYARSMLVFGLVSGVFIYLFRGRVDGYDILGVDALGFLFNFLGANLRHSHVWLSFGPLERLLISPAQHQIHHSAAPRHRDKNFGTCLALWDRLGGSWLPAGRRRRLRFGIATRAESPGAPATPV